MSTNAAKLNSSIEPEKIGWLAKLINNYVRQHIGAQTKVDTDLDLAGSTTGTTTNEIKVSTPTVIVPQIRSDVRR